jgi:hypothetical protein
MLRVYGPHSPNFGRLHGHRRRPGRKTLDQVAQLRDLDVRRQATWGMSVVAQCLYLFTERQMEDILLMFRKIKNLSILTFALMTSQAYAFGDEAKNMANSEMGQRWSTNIAEALSHSEYAICKHTNITALAFWARGELTDPNLLILNQIILNGLAEYRANFISQYGTAEPIDDVFTSIQPVYNANRQAYWQECNSFINPLLR